MRITTKGQLAVTALVDLATRGGNAPIKLQTISDRQNISLSYLEQLFAKLRRHNIVESIRGPGGGYCLARASSQITVADIITAVDGSLDLANYERREKSQDRQSCSTDTLWHGLNRMLQAYLSTVNVQQLVDEHRQEGAEVSTMTRSSRVGIRNTTTRPRASL